MLPAALRGSQCPMAFLHYLSERTFWSVARCTETHQAQFEVNPAPTAAGCARLTAFLCYCLCFPCHHQDKPHPRPSDGFWKSSQEQSQGRPLPAPSPHLLLACLVVVTTVPSKKKLLSKSQLLGLVELPLRFTPVTEVTEGQLSPSSSQADDFTCLS